MDRGQQCFAHHRHSTVGAAFGARMIIIPLCAVSLRTLFLKISALCGMNVSVRQRSRLQIWQGRNPTQLASLPIQRGAFALFAICPARSSLLDVGHNGTGGSSHRSVAMQPSVMGSYPPVKIGSPTPSQNPR